MAKVGQNSGSSNSNPLEAPVVSWHPLRKHMFYGMDYNIRIQEAPNTPPPVPRQSLAQMTLIHRYQNSHYLSVLRYFGLRPDYPAFHGFKIVNGKPFVSDTATPTMAAAYPGLPIGDVAPFPRPRSAGTMKPPTRFVKALPLPIPSFNPPTYGVEGQ